MSKFGIFCRLYPGATPDCHRPIGSRLEQEGGGANHETGAKIKNVQVIVKKVLSPYGVIYSAVYGERT